MTDDNITRLHPRPREATCTHAVPSESPDAPHLERSNLRDLAPQEEETLGRVGLNTDQWPGMAVRPARQVAERELKELRQRADSLVEAAASLEIACRLVRTEAETMVRWLGEKLGDDDNPPKGAA